MQCEELECAKCQVHCEQPECSVRCPKDMCETGDCPKCETVCAPAACHTTCVAPEAKCSPLCEETQCNWSCAKPTTCPRPKCELQCEKPACDIEDVAAPAAEPENQCCECSEENVASAMSVADATSPAEEEVKPTLLEVMHSLRHSQKDMCCPCQAK
jgi:hypothetical protein